jgi:hypothetical protein
MNPRYAGKKSFHRLHLQPLFVLFREKGRRMKFPGRKTDPEKFYNNRRRVQVWRMMR